MMQLLSVNSHCGRYGSAKTNCALSRLQMPVATTNRTVLVVVLMRANLQNLHPAESAALHTIRVWLGQRFQAAQGVAALQDAAA